MASITKEFLEQQDFVERLYQEQRRTERSRTPFIFLLLESVKLLKPEPKQDIPEQIARLLTKSIRETDVRGWYKNGSAIGVIFTEINSPDVQLVGDRLVAKIRGILSEKLTPSQMNQIDLSFCVFPEDWDKDGSAAASGLYPASRNSKRVAHVFKRSLDISGSLAALLIGSPIFLAVAAAVKLTSSGPVFFKQERVGQHGRKFSFLKFRSMYVNNDQEIHKKYVQGLIEGNAASGNGTGCQTAVFKLTNDPRITSVGRFLRKASLDEIPQFLNVLMGDMSLVGPRPPIPYEVDSYDIWHRRRLLAVRPGITGLWQVSGRSRTTFDEMVRLDLQYARSWSVFMDLEILLRTPRAVVSGDGAY